MITYKMITDAQTLIVENWGEQGERVIEQCAMSNPFNNTFESFLSRCTMCGGNWGAMLLTGIRDMWANVWDAIPNDMGALAFPCLCAVLVLCGVDASQNQCLTIGWECVIITIEREVMTMTKLENVVTLDLTIEEREALAVASDILAKVQVDLANCIKLRAVETGEIIESNELGRVRGILDGLAENLCFCAMLNLK